MKGGNKGEKTEPAARGVRKRRAVPELSSAQQFPSLGTSGATVPLNAETVSVAKQHGKDDVDDVEEKERIRLAKKAFYKKKKKERAQRKKAKLAQEAMAEEKKKAEEHTVQHVDSPPQPPQQPERPEVATAATTTIGVQAATAAKTTTTTTTKPVVRVKKVKTTLGELMVTGMPGKLEKKTSKKKATPQVVTLPMYDEEGNRIVVLGRGAKTNGIVLRRANKRRRVSSMKKALFRARVRAALQDTAAAPESVSQLLDEFVRAARGMSRKERKQQAAALPPLLCQWGSCTASFGNTKAALEEFRTHLEAHARQQAQFVFYSSCRLSVQH